MTTVTQQLENDNNERNWLKKKNQKPKTPKWKLWSSRVK